MPRRASPPSPRAATRRQLVIVTGLSGSGKGTALNTFEDLGFYCVDNLPVELIPSFSELVLRASGEVERAALLVDAREGEKLARRGGLPDIVRRLKRSSPFRVTLVFIEASDDALVRRFSETRRPHPFTLSARGGREEKRNVGVLGGIRRERRMMAPIRRMADVIVDTTRFNVHELRQFIADRFSPALGAGRRPLLVSVVSFGFRYGVPPDADLVFDVRFLPNPHFVPQFRPYSGKNPRVARYIRGFPQTGEFLRRVESLLLFLVPHYIREGKSYLTIAFGCTGGRHRSVMMAESVGQVLARRGYTTKVVHRDMDKS